MDLSDVLPGGTVNGQTSVMGFEFQGSGSCKHEAPKEGLVACFVVVAALLMTPGRSELPK